MIEEDLLPESPGAALANWREIREKIQDESDRATTEQHRVALLVAHKALMDLVEGTGIHKDDLEAFRKARKQDYNLLVVKECLVGENVCTETAYAVTRREIAAGRMAPDDPFAVDIEKAMAAPHYSRAQLIDIEQNRQKASQKANGKGGGSMVERLGYVLYWACCIVAALLAVIAVVVVFGTEPVFGVVFGFCALVAYGVGRGIRYVLAGK